MGRAFEYRKATKLKRWGHMARTFTKLGKEITIAAREGGSDPNGNPRLRMLIQQCKRENMPKDNIDRAIKKATDKDAGEYKEINYEGYGPHGVAIFIETATDNHMRTVANIRSYFTKHGGNLGTQGCLQFRLRPWQRRAWHHGHERLPLRTQMLLRRRLQGRCRYGRTRTRTH